MKTFKKIILASAISAAPFASQAMEALDDTVLGNTTGQAGVTIEIELGTDGIKVGEVLYTDTGAGATGGGSVSLEHISVTGLGKLTQTIDVNENGDLLMTTTAPTEDIVITLGNDLAGSPGEFSALKLLAADGSESEIINNLDITMKLGASTTTIKNLGTAGSGGLGALGVTGSHATDVSSMAIVMSSSLEITDMNLGLFGYTDTQAAILAPGAQAKIAAGYNAGFTAAALADTDLTAAAQTAAQDAQDLIDPAVTVAPVAAITANQDGYTAGYASTIGDTDSNGTVTAAEVEAELNVEASLAAGSAIQITGLTVSGSGGGAMSIDQTIWAVGGNAKLPGSTAGVYIQIGAMDMDIGIASIAIGGSSIGSVAIKGLELAGMTQRIYGH
ncbi:MAG: hypothetical protein JKY50_15330 [Oleispira sp.]|nr:hypothetical protein [Oleispira sp.]MBL4882214.1 hypothetical protein [Oleispira sp.]